SPTLPVTIGIGSATSPSFYSRDRGAGNAVLTVTAAAKQNGTQTETVNAGPLAALKVAPAALTIVPGGKRPYTARGVDAFGNTVPVASVNWSVGAGTPGSVSPAAGLSTMFLAGTTPGSGTVVATLATASGTLTASGTVTVSPAAGVTTIAYSNVGSDVVVTLSVHDSTGARVAGASAA